MRCSIAISSALMAATALAQEVACRVGGIQQSVVDLDTGVCPFVIPDSLPVNFNYTALDDYLVDAYYVSAGTKYFNNITAAGRTIDIPAKLLYNSAAIPLFHIHTEAGAVASSTKFGTTSAVTTETPKYNTTSVVTKTSTPTTTSLVTETSKPTTTSLVTTEVSSSSGGLSSLTNSVAISKSPTCTPEIYVTHSSTLTFGCVKEDCTPLMYFTTSDGIEYAVNIPCPTFRKRSNLQLVEKRDIPPFFLESIKAMDGTKVELSGEIVDFSVSDPDVSLSESSGSSSTEDSSTETSSASGSGSVEAGSSSTDNGSSFTETGSSFGSTMTGSGVVEGNSTQTVTAILSTIVTITSCFDHKCHETTVPATWGPVTTTLEGGVVTVYTTWCPVIETTSTTVYETVVCTKDVCKTSTVTGIFYPGKTSTVTGVLSPAKTSTVTGVLSPAKTTLATLGTSTTGTTNPTVSTAVNGATRIVGSVLVLVAVPLAYLW